MACGTCGGNANKQVFKVIAADGSSKSFSTYPQAQQEARQNGGRIKVTYERK